MDTPKLTIGDLLKIGLLTDTPAFKYVVAGDTTFLLTWYGRDSSLKTVWLSYNAPFKAFVEIVWERRGKFERPFFKCANTGKICSTLYFNGADWAHRTDTTIKQNRRPRPLRDVLADRHDRLRLRLLGEDGRGPPRTKRRLEIVAHFKNHPHYVADHPDLRRAIEAIEARAFLKLRPIVRSNQTNGPLSTRAGLIDAQVDGVPALKLYDTETNYRRASMPGLIRKERLAGAEQRFSQAVGLSQMTLIQNAAEAHFSFRHHLQAALMWGA